MNLRRFVIGLILLWALFAGLVYFEVSGSSLGAAVEWWSPETRYRDYLLQPLVDRLAAGVGGTPRAALIEELCLARARCDRSDEYGIWLPWALGQVAHDPPFPVVNRNIGDGQNMLIAYAAPVLHPTAVSRPVTWGYLLFGAGRGLAWNWWFQVFSCFTALSILFSIVLRGCYGLAVFGAFWFCTSAYVVCWSFWPAYAAFFPALCCVSAYHLLKSPRPLVQGLAAVGVGLSAPGFLMILYPPWQIPLGIFFATVFVGLFIRDVLHRTMRERWRSRVLAVSLALTLAAGLSISFLLATTDVFEIMRATVYPGQRVSAGGHYPLAMLFRGIFNVVTNYETPLFLTNVSSAASFIHLFPAALLACATSVRVARSLGVVGGLVAAFIVFIVVFMVVGFPGWLARSTLLDLVSSTRADLALGLASILLCVMTLEARAGRARETGSRWSLTIPILAGLLMTAVTLRVGMTGRQLDPRFLGPGTIVAMAAVLGTCAYLLAAGRVGALVMLMVPLLVVTSGFFNPLVRGVEPLYAGELAGKIRELNQAAVDRPLWLCYGGRQTGVLVTAMGGRSIAGVHAHPQFSLWSELDPDGGHRRIYNRYAHVVMQPRGAGDPVVFSLLQREVVGVAISPFHPALKARNARFVLGTGAAQNLLDCYPLKRLYKSKTGWFTIYEIPAP